CPAAMVSALVRRHSRDAFGLLHESVARVPHGRRARRAVLGGQQRPRLGRLRVELPRRSAHRGRAVLRRIHLPRARARDRRLRRQDHARRPARRPAPPARPPLARLALNAPTRPLTLPRAARTRLPWPWSPPAPPPDRSP